MTNPKAHAPNATQRRYKAKPIRLGPAEQPPRPPDAYFGRGEAERPGYALIPQLVGRTWVWPKADPAIHGEPAERTGQRAWWDGGSKW